MLCAPHALNDRKQTNDLFRLWRFGHSFDICAVATGDRMEILMQFLYLLEKIRNPVFDFFFSTVTHLGEETVFLVIALLFFWCIGKREGYFMLITCLVGTVINQAAKLIFKIPRPWVKDPDFTIVESAREEATGYSFPSGHTQNATGTFGVIGRTAKHRGVRIASVVIIALVALSRMYLGVHTPHDVVVSLLVGAALVFSLYPLFSSEERFRRFMPFVVIGSCLLAIGLTVFVFTMSPDGVDPHNLKSGMKNSATLLGCTAGLVAVYVTDTKWIRFETDAKWYAQILKFVLGLLGVIAIKSGLSAPLVALFGNEYIARGVRYFLIVIFAGCLWPLSFKLFSRMRIGVLDNIFKKKVTETSSADGTDEQA